MHARLCALALALAATPAPAGDAPTAARGSWSHGSVAPAGTMFELGYQPRPGLAFYRLSEFEGAALILRETEPDISRFGLGNRARSVRVSGRWLLCAEPEFAGQCVEVSSSQPRLAWSQRLTRVGSARYLGRAGEALEMR
jgi:hypothetical protein